MVDPPVLPLSVDKAENKAGALLSRCSRSPRCLRSDSIAIHRSPALATHPFASSAPYL